MAPRSDATISAQLNKAQIIIGNSQQNSEIRDLVAARGYTATVLLEGQYLYEAATKAVDAQAAAAGEQLLATDRAEAAERAARASYQRLAQTVRAIFPANSPQRKALEITGPMPQESAAFLAVATTLFNNASRIGDIAVVLAKYGYNEQTLRDEHALITVYQQALQAQALAKGAAKQATRGQNEALTALQQWMAQYLKIAKIALRDQPELLKAIAFPATKRRAAAQNSGQAANPMP